MEITIESKDRLLAMIIDRERVPRTYLPYSAVEQAGIDPAIVQPVVYELRELHMLSELRFLEDSVSFKFHSNLNQFASRGGFHSQELFLQAELDKLILEVNILKRELEPNILERIKHILQLGESAGAIIQCLQGLVR